MKLLGLACLSLLGCAEVEANLPGADAAIGSADAAVPARDASGPQADAASDAGDPQPLMDSSVAGDSGPMPSDAGRTRDAGEHLEAGHPPVKDAGKGPAEAGTPDAGTPDSGPAEPVHFYRELPTASHFSALAGAGAEVKYLTRVNGASEPDIFDESECLFQNTDEFPYHLQFLRSFDTLEALSAQRYEDWLLRRESRTLYGGMLKLLPAARHPLSGELGVLVYTIYTAPSAGEQLTLPELVAVDQRLGACVTFARDWLVFLPTDAAQLRATQALEPELSEAGVVFIEPADLDDGLAAEGYSEGEAYGYLQLMNSETALDAGPRDVVVVDAAPNDLGLVAGLVTHQPQSVASHLNLRLREKGIPNARASDVFESGLLQQWQGLLVHLSVTAQEVHIEPAKLSDAEAFWLAHAPTTGELHSDLSVETLAPIAELKHDDALAYGVKAANLGELRSVLPASNRMDGFAIPFKAYADFVAQPELQAAIEAALNDPELRVDAAHKQSVLKALRRTLRDAALPAAWEADLHVAVETAFGSSGNTTRLRFRSSTNAEDLPGVSGAGLYDSASGCIADDLDDDSVGPSACLSDEQRDYYELELQTRRQELEDFPERTYLEDVIVDLEEELSEEKSAERALKKVWASLWNDRAFDDREYYQLDHRQVLMGVAVHPALVGERLEAVVVTNLEAASEQPLYRVVSQRGEVGVVRPYDPSATAEVLTFRRGAGDQLADFEVVSGSSLMPEGEHLWSETDVAELAALLFEVQDHFASEVYPQIEPLALDIEVDVDSAGEIRIKQARPYANALLP